MNAYINLTRVLALTIIIALPVQAKAAPFHTSQSALEITPEVINAGLLFRERMSREEYLAALRRDRAKKRELEFRDRPNENPRIYRPSSRERIFTYGQAFGPDAHRRVRPEYR